MISNAFEQDHLSHSKSYVYLFLKKKSYFRKLNAISSYRTNSAIRICFANADLNLKKGNYFPGFVLLSQIMIRNFNLIIKFYLCLICHQMIAEKKVENIFFFSKAGWIKIPIKISILKDIYQLKLNYKIQLVLDLDIWL